MKSILSIINLIKLSLLVGAFGTGKSVFMEDVIMNALGTKGRVFVLDLGRSFEKLIEPCAGQHLCFSKTSHLKLNPFSLIPEGADKDTTDDALSMVFPILATIATPKEKITKNEENSLKKAEKKAYCRNLHGDQGSRPISFPCRKRHVGRSNHPRNLFQARQSINQRI